jgi:hypothetical protein
MLVAGTRRRNQPPPPTVVFEALTQPHRDPTRPWLKLQKHEVEPRIIETVEHSLVVWSSIWTKRPDALIRFELEGAGSTDLRWTLFVDEPMPDDVLVGHFRKRLNVLINANLRFTFGQ